MKISDKALSVIEWMCLEATNPPQELLDGIYKYVHVATGRCKADHSDWVKELEELFSQLTVAGQI